MSIAVSQKAAGHLLHAVHTCEESGMLHVELH